MSFDQRIWNAFTMPLARQLPTYSKSDIEFICILMTLVIGLVDFLVGIEIRMNVFYFIPIAIAAWYIGPNFAFMITLLSCGLWLIDDAPYRPSIVEPLINDSFRFILSGFWIVTLVRLNELQRNLTERAEVRALELAAEIAGRQQLEHDMLEISEREQRRIGQDLHDGLCQHLTGTALAGHVLAQKLALRDLPEAASADKIVELVEEAIGLARSMAKGLHPVDMESDGLMQALEEFAYTTSEMFRLNCRFECHVPVPVRPPAAATHLYRIAQEGVSNAIKHGRATEIVILLEESEAGIRLRILDNGSGFSGQPSRNDGMGLRIMAGRAGMIGGRFSIEPVAGGSELSCVIPRDNCFGSEAHA